MQAPQGFQPKIHYLGTGNQLLKTEYFLKNFYPEPRNFTIAPIFKK